MKTLGISANFLAIEDASSRFATSRVVVLPVPYERTVSYGGGTKRGPAAILKASHYVELYDEETRREVYRELGIATLPPFPTGKKKDKAFLKELEALTAKLLKAGKFVLTLGGEHTISQAPVAAYAKAYPGLSVLQIDAHSDLREEYQGSPYSHASVMARVCEIIDPKRLVQVGIRAQCIEEAAFIRREGVTTLYAHEIRGGKYNAGTRSWEDYAIDQLSEHVYVSFDVDGLDPSVMPATGTPEPNGLTYDEAMRLLKKVGERRNVVGCDIVELAPMKGLHHPDLTSAKLASKMINYFVR
jgi:agmatinase